MIATTFDTPARPAQRALPWMAAASAIAAIAASLGVLPPPFSVVFKPLTTLLLIARAWPRGVDRPTLRRWVIAGLVLSLVGDVALLWPKQGFLPGLVAFLFAHLAYIRAFSVPVRFGARPMVFVLYGVVAALILSQLWSGVPAALRVPVAAYVVCLATMAAQAASGWGTGIGTAGESSGRRAAIGGVLFMVSDSLLAFNKFATPLPVAGLWILASYWLAQGFIAGSLRRR
jgi:uncharacterized membrane protein YhhN